jgi:hypothetical protein
MKLHHKIIWICTVGILALIVIIESQQTKYPDDHIAYPKEGIAEVRFYNHSSCGPEKDTSEIIHILVDDFGDCDMVGKLKIKDNGDIGVCTSAGWKIHQVDQ